MNPKLEFLYRSLEDTQGTIRALDVKLGAILLVLIVPMGELDGIYEKVSTLVISSSLWSVLVGIFCVCWSGAVWTVFAGLVAIGDARATISGSIPEGTFFGGGYFDFCWKDAFFNWEKKSNQRLKEAGGDIPNDDSAICEELIFEKMKLAYIRGIKIKRAQFGAVLALVFIFIGAAIWIAHIAVIGNA